MEYVKVIKPGLLTTVQDLGRHAYQHAGVSACGAMDALSLRLANILVGNHEGEAALEATIVGPQLLFQAEGVIAITGGNLSPSLNGKPVPMWKSIRVYKGDQLRFGWCADGSRAYIAFAGGIQVPPVLGSRSTFIRGQYGGLEGRALKAGDALPTGEARHHFREIAGRTLHPKWIPDYKKERPIRFIWGPQADAFTAKSREVFTTHPYILSNESDRMGYRLQGERLSHKDRADIITDFITAGAIQVPADGQPIILMADCQMSGGYTKIGVIIGVDLPYTAQKKPGDPISFQAVEVTQAQQEWKRQERWLSTLRSNNQMIIDK